MVGQIQIVQAGQPIGKLYGFLGVYFPVEHPECNNVVIHFFIRWNFHQADTAFPPPFTKRFHPKAWPLVIVSFEIHIVVIVPVTLHEPEASGVVIHEGADV